MASQEYQERLRKAEELRALGINPYPARFEASHSIAQVNVSKEANETRTVEDILADKIDARFTIRGRLMTMREHGRLAFANLKDVTGTIQVCFMEQVLGKENYKLLRKVDMGDFIGATGELFMTKHGQLTLLIQEWTFLGKTLRPLPEKWHGLQDQEAKYRQRYLDLVMSDETMNRFVFRSRFIEETRQFLNAHQFMEVETPVLAAVASGATARPFMTHHNALDLDVHLRIAPELYLKRLIAGGMERVYEFAKCFRNEGMDPSHLQEFTMLEYYGAYWNYLDNMNFTEQMLTTVIEKCFGTLKIKVRSRDGEDMEVDFTAPWKRLDFGELILRDSGIDIYAVDEDADKLRAAIAKKKIVIEGAETMGYGNLCDYLYKKVSRPKLIDPCFVINHPASTKPLARRSDANPKVCETFQLLVNTWEVVNAYSELVDPIDQRERFIEQAKAAAGGDQDAMDMDIDYLAAMEHGMPPISGFGMGIDRIVTLLTGQDNLRDVVLFPIMRPLDEDLKAAKKINDKAREAAKKSGAGTRDISKFLEEPLTTLLYWEDFECTKFKSTVEEVSEKDGRTVLTLKETTFYPQGGGQPYDQGSLTSKSGTFQVEEVRFVDRKVQHIGTFTKGSFKVGEKVEGQIDEERRLYLARIHSAGHIVDMTMKELGLGWIQGKGYHFPEGPYDEYEGSLEGHDKEELKAAFEKKANELLKKVPPVEVKLLTKKEMEKVCDSVPEYLSDKKKGRVMMYADYGMACGGTPVKDSKKIGHITIRKIKSEGGKIRVGYDVE